MNDGVFKKAKELVKSIEFNEKWYGYFESDYKKIKLEKEGRRFYLRVYEWMGIGWSGKYADEMIVEDDLREQLKSFFDKKIIEQKEEFENL